MIKVITILFSFLFTVIKGIGELLISLFLVQKRKTEYDADFASVNELLSAFNSGYCLDGRHCETIQDSFKNAIIFGSTGNFKSSGILIPTILRMRGYASLIINDPSKELFLKTSGVLN